jgi:hypothetical protein
MEMAKGPTRLSTDTARLTLRGTTTAWHTIRLSSLNPVVKVTERLTRLRLVLTRLTLHHSLTRNTRLSRHGLLHSRLLRLRDGDAIRREVQVLALQLIHRKTIIHSNPLKQTQQMLVAKTRDGSRQCRSHDHYIYP